MIETQISSIKDEKNIALLPFSLIIESSEIHFCLNVQKVATVLELDESSLLPVTMQPFKYLVDMSGTPVPVLELKNLTTTDSNYSNAAPKTKRARATKKRVIVCNTLGIYIGIIVDFTKKIQIHLNDKIIPPPSVWESSNQLYVSGLIKENNYYRYMFDIEKYIFSFGYSFGEVKEVKGDHINDLSKRKTLVVEDSAVYQLLLKKFMEKYGVHADYAKNGKEGLELMLKNKGKYDFILSDIEMPYMNGIEMVREYKNQTQDYGLPIIFHSTITNSNLEQDLKDDNLGVFLGKFDEDDLLKGILSCLNKT